MSPEILSGRFEVLRSLGRGGMGDVMLVRDGRDGRELALKRLHLRNEEAAARFRDEFAILARIEHPNIVRVFDFGSLPQSEGGGAYFTMEFLDGKAMDEAIAPGEIEPVLAATLDIWTGLSALYAAGLVHCDLKPSNVLMLQGSDGIPYAKLLDFGLVGHLGELGPPVTEHQLPGEASATRVRGTVGYVAPEVLDGGPYTEASDSYGLGATLY